MLHKLSERIVAYAVEINALDNNKAEEYIYGLELTLAVLLNDISVIIIGFLMGMIWQAILFLFLSSLIRRFAGGFHFSSQIRCYLSMCIMCPLILLIIKYSANNVLAWSVIMAVSTLILLIVSPVPALEKPLDEKEENVYGFISRIIIIAAAAAYAVLCGFGQVYIAKIIAITVSVVAIFAILGKVKHKLYGQKKAVS